MKLLITTQAVDRNDPILGFFHNWLVEFAKHFERIDVICLREGEHDLPANVHVHSLGKESGKSRLKYIWNFYKYLWQLRGEYDAVFSHMNPHYIVLGGFLWKLSSKRIFFWRNHAKMNLMTWIAAQFAEKVFYTSPYACTTRFKHSVQMPVGIDTGIFKPDPAIERKERTILFLGRLSPVKRPELFLKAAKDLLDFKVDVYGGVQNAPSEYLEELKSLAGPGTEFHGAVANTDTPTLYSAHEIYVNLTPKGSMDKTMLEAAACGALLVVANDSLREQLPKEMFLVNDNPETVRRQIHELTALPDHIKDEYRKKLRNMVVEEHSLEKLGSLLFKYIAHD